ncbi:MT0933-like antitoxin protein [Pseudonocardia thermophila]|mgnify:CR=1 FL=1|uniref:MT0933-like antitoxin protein n=1 Tax=Pseudonocardia thermophila TaxID=1848 RepID=A0A1M7AQH8_PSETH|nr:antitoxin [Pseudonocardia thermophila]SHL45034.1 MT0933-like antitoxin protein [Pseudonocardia thermophila]
MPKLRNLAVLVTAAEAARRYARSNPEQAGKYLDQAAAFIDKQTKGKYSAKISDITSKVKGVAGIPTTPPAGPAANGRTSPSPTGQPTGSTPPPQS